MSNLGRKSLPFLPLSLRLGGLAVICTSLMTGAVQAEIVKGRVVAVADGDTITVLDINKTQHKVRLAGIDAPEKSQPFGQRSKESLSGMVFDREVLVETTKRDRYGREIGKVTTDGLDTNLEQLKRGMAWHYKAYQSEQSKEDRVSYSEAENNARRASVGLWKDKEPVPPWDFRHSKRGTN